MQDVHSLHTFIWICKYAYTTNLPPSDDYNRVLLKLDEGHSRESDPDEDEEEDSSDEEEEESTKYINASHINVCYF